MNFNGQRQIPKKDQKVLKNAQPQIAEEMSPTTTMSPPWTTIARLDRRQMPESRR